MASLDLHIELGRQPAEYRPGEDVSGSLVVTVDAPAFCREIAVETAYRGGASRGVDGRLDLGARSFEPGTHRIPFAIMAPDGPMSYSGKIVHLVWEVRARADVDWAIDPKAAHTFRLLPWTREAAITGPVFRASRREVREAYEVAPEGAGDARNPSAMPPGCATAYGGCLVVAAAIVLMLWQAPGGWSLAGLLGISAVVCLAWGVPKWVSQRTLGAPRLEIVSDSLDAGEEVEVAVHFTPTKKVEGLHVRLELSCSEIVLERNSDQSTRTVREVVLIEHATLLSDSTVAAGEPVTLHGGWRIPDAGPPTLRVDDAEVRWEVTLDATWPSGHHREARTITVAPARIGASG